MKNLFFALLILVGCTSNEAIKPKAPKYYYRLSQVDNNGEIHRHNISTARVLSQEIFDYYLQIDGIFINKADHDIIISDTVYVVGQVHVFDVHNFHITPTGFLFVTDSLIIDKGNFINEGKLSVAKSIVVSFNANFPNTGEVNTCNPVIGNYLGVWNESIKEKNKRFEYSCNGELPITLLSFTVKPTEEGNLIEYTTTSETNSSHVIIEYSTDAVNFFKLTQIPSVYPNGGKYSYVHKLND